MISPTEILTSLATSGLITGLGFVDAADVLKLTATGLGEATAGAFEMYFDGSDVGLSGYGENVDAIERLDDGRLLLSTDGAFNVPGVAGGAEDLLAFSPTSLGTSTAGTWELYFDGSDVGLSGSNENVDAVGLDSSGNVCLSTSGDFSVPGLAGTDEDAFVFEPTSLGSDTAGSYWPALYFDGSSHGLGTNDVVAIDVPMRHEPPPAEPLGPIGFVRLDDQDPSAGELWYSFETMHSGFLTTEAIFEGAPDSAALTLYDENRSDPPLAVSTAVDGGQRIDRQADTGETYYLKLTGTNTDVDLRLANLVNHVGTVVTVSGTDGADQFEFDAAASRRVVINGVGYEFDDAEVTSVSFDGAAGEDTATLTGSPDDETVKVYPTSATWTGPVDVSVANTAQITVHSGGGSDTAKLYDSPGDDMLIVTPDEASLTGPGYSNQAVGFGFAMGIAREDGYDTAKLDDSPGEDVFLGTPTYSKMSTGGETYAYAKSFEHVIGYSRTGSDTAILKDSPGDDKFVGRSTYGKLSGPAFKVQAQWFDALEACANSTGDDRAYLFDSPGDDWFIGDPTEAVMRGVGFHNTARWFETAYGYGTGGGMDRAIFYDSSGNDTFVGTSTRGRLTGPGYYLQAVRCDVVRAFSQSGGQDKARLFDSAGDDVLIATLEYSYLRGSPSTGNFKNRADGFAEVESTARFGGNDTARLYDSALDDYLHAEGNSAVMGWDATWEPTWNAKWILLAYDFDHVEADGSKGGVNRLKKVLPIDFALTVTDPLDWILV